MARTIEFSGYGGPEVLRVVDAPIPDAGPGQVQVAVRAAGVNPIDAKIMQGFMREVMPLTLPAGLGSDVAGVVKQVGAGVTAFHIGDEVMGSSLPPAISEYALADSANLIIKPADIGWDVAGSVAGAGAPHGRYSSVSRSARAKPCSSTPRPAGWARSRFNSPSRAERG